MPIIKISEEEFKELIAAGEAAKASRVRIMPTEHHALRVIMEAYERLKELGWRDAMYAPKDGTVFEVWEVGSTGIFDCNYSGKWPDGCWMVYDGGDVYPSSMSPAMFHPKGIATDGIAR